MRTDSNTMLSLSSGVLPKTSKSPLLASDNGAAFEDDFKKAKVAFDPENERLADKQALKEYALSDESHAATKPIEQSEVALKEGSSGAVVAKEDGKVLQPEGDVSPTKLNDSEKEVEPASLSSLSLFELEVEPSSLSSLSSLELEVEPSSLSSLSSLELEAGAKEVLDEKVLIDMDAHIDIVETQVSDLEEMQLSDLPRTDLDLSNFQNIEGSDFKADLQKGEPVQASVFLSQSEKPVEALDPEKLVLTPLSQGVKPVNKDNELVWGDSEGLEVELPLEDDSQLSWVLSQMNARTSSATGERSQESLAAPALLGASLGRGAAPASVSLDGDPELGTEGFDLTDADLTDSSDTLLLDDLILIDEPVELRKKEQEAMFSRMSGQIDGKVIEEGVSNLNNSTSSVRAVSTGAVSTIAPQANLTMNVPPQHPSWASEMSQKVAWVARDGGHTAHIRLDPPELGSLTVKISVDNDSNTQVSFIAATPQARELLEGQMNRLRDMLAQQGMDLSRADVDVSQQDTSGMRRDSEQDSTSNQTELAAQEEIDDELISRNMSYVTATGVDYYA
ncbi:flagellar hook-length control protein FliK [Marinomonas sp. 5E14-1]|uniref:flagellar hook-length control protein FliK n=1 Tax=Marinomonas sp. 5E14-1 TaxID=3153922 RepID=UPI0032642693